MSTPGRAPDFQAANEAEHAALEREWAGGTLVKLREPLLRFVGRHREEILRRAPDRDLAALLEATRAVIREARTVDLASENRDQLREIRNELWYRGEEGNHDVQAIEDAWARRHAPNWRRWRMLQYLFLSERLAADVLRELQKE